MVIQTKKKKTFLRDMKRENYKLKQVSHRSVVGTDVRCTGRRSLPQTSDLCAHI